MDAVNHPAHYNRGKIEVIDFIEDQRLGFHLGNAIKYICRSGAKADAVTDLKKAVWYINRKIAQYEEEAAVLDGKGEKGEKGGST